MLLSSTENIAIVAEADRGEAACQLYIEKKPDVVVMDLSMPGIGGLECIRRIRNRDPQAKILIFSVHDELVYLNRAIEAGALGYITKNSAPEILIDAILQIAVGNLYIESGLAKPGKYLSEIDYHVIINSLSPKEFDIFRLLSKGMTAHKIAEELCLSYKTVANYGTQIKIKFNVSTVAELAHIATAFGIIKE